MSHIFNLIYHLIWTQKVQKFHHLYFSKLFIFSASWMSFCQSCQFYEPNFNSRKWYLSNPNPNNYGVVHNKTLNLNRFLIQVSIFKDHKISFCLGCFLHILSSLPPNDNETEAHHVEAVQMASLVNPGESTPIFTTNANRAA